MALLSFFYSPRSKLGVYLNPFYVDDGKTSTSKLIPAQVKLNITTTIGGLDFTNGLDGPTSENIILSRKVTYHPVQGKSPISDHAIKNPTIIRFRGIINALNPALILGGISVQRLTNGNQLLLDLFEVQTGLTIMTSFIASNSAVPTIDLPYKRFDNLIITNLSIGGNEGDIKPTSTVFTMECQQLKIVPSLSSVVKSNFSKAKTTDNPPPTINNLV